MTIKDALSEAHKLLRKAVPISRRKAQQELGTLAQTYHAAMQQWDQLKADGVPLSERVAYLEKTLRAAWPFTREWKYLCEECNDLGWSFHVCMNKSCGRPFTFPRQRADDYTGRGRCQDGHTFVRPCWCQKGQAFKRQLMREGPAGDPVATAAKVSKPMSRLGR